MIAVRDERIQRGQSGDLAAAHQAARVHDLRCDRFVGRVPVRRSAGQLLHQSGGHVRCAAVPRPGRARGARRRHHHHRRRRRCVLDPGDPEPARLELRHPLQWLRCPRRAAADARWPRFAVVHGSRSWRTVVGGDAGEAQRRRGHARCSDASADHRGARARRSRGGAAPVLGLRARHRHPAARRRCVGSLRRPARAGRGVHPRPPGRDPRADGPERGGEDDSVRRSVRPAPSGGRCDPAQRSGRDRAVGVPARLQRSGAHVPASEAVRRPDLVGGVAPSRCSGALRRTR